MAHSETVSTSEDLHLWRFNNKLSMAEAAAFLAVSAKTVSNWEAGRYPRDLFRRLQEAEAKRAASSALGQTPAQADAAKKNTLKASQAWLKEQAAARHATFVRKKTAGGRLLPGPDTEPQDVYKARVRREHVDLFGFACWED